MTVARMHKQRKVTRATDKPRYTRQKPIKRGGAAPPPGPVIPFPAVETVSPTTLVLGTPTVVTFTGSDFVDGCIVATGPLFTFPTVFVSDTEVTATLPCDTAGTYQVFVMNNPAGADQDAQRWSNITDIPCA
jgi:hypothetical protein